MDLNEWDKSRKKEVAEAASVQLSDVEDVLDKYEELKDFHNFLRERKKQGLPMPESREDLVAIYKIERPAFLMRNQKEKQNYNRKQMMYAMRRHYT